MDPTTKESLLGKLSGQSPENQLRAQVSKISHAGASFPHATTYLHHPLTPPWN